MPDASLRFRAPTRLRRLAGVATTAVFGSILVGAAPVAVEHAGAVTPTVATVANVVSWAPYWQSGTALQSFVGQSSSFDELTPFFFTVTSGPTGPTIGFNSNMSPSTRSASLAAYRTAATNAGKPLVPTLVDAMGARGMAGVLADPTARAAHEQAIMDFVTGTGTNSSGPFDGIDLDYENFAFSDGRASWPDTDAGPGTRTNWASFLTELSAMLHAAGKTLAVSVPPIYNSGQDSNSGYWVYDFATMGQVADHIRIMTYSYSVSAPGPIAPYNWVSSSIDAAINIGVPRSKIQMGIPAYGTNWVTNIEGSCPVDPATAGTSNVKLITPGKGSVTTAGAPAFAQKKGVVPVWDATTREMKFSYVDAFAGKDLNGANVECNVSRTVWYEDSQAIYQRVMLAQSKGIEGVAIWALGNDDPATWNAILAARNGTKFTPPDPLPPAVVPPPGTPVTSIGALPARYVDTRINQKTADGQYAAKGHTTADSTLTVQIAGRGPVPSGATAVTLNVTALGLGTGFITVYPCGTRPTTSSLNVKTGQTISNSVITKLSSSGAVCIYTQQAADLVVDVFNVLADTTYAPLPTPARLLDTRPGQTTIDGQFNGGGVIKAGSTIELPVAGRGGMADAAQTAVLNVTAVDAAGAGFLTVWPCGTAQPTTSNVNYTAGVAVPNAVVTGLSVNGTICVFSSNTTNVVIDTFGELNTDNFLALPQPSRLLETRPGLTTVDGQFNGIGVLTAGSTTEIPFAARGGLPTNPTAVVLNVTVDQPELAGWVVVYPCGTARPLASNINFAAGQTLPNLVVTKLSTTGSVCVYANVKLHLVIDAFGSMNL